MNYREINTLSRSLGLRQAIRQEANNEVYQKVKVGQYVNDMERGITAAIPEFANMLEMQEAAGQIPNPNEVKKQVQQEIEGGLVR